jgi:hypothetical protein
MPREASRGFILSSLRTALLLASGCLSFAGPALAQQKTITVAAHYTEDQVRPPTACFRR